MPRTLATIAAAGVLATGGIAVNDARTFDGPPLPEAVIEAAGERIEARAVDNKAEVTLPWKDAAPIKISRDFGEPTVGERMRDKRDQEAIIDNTSFGEGGVKFDILLNKKPEDNTFCYQVEGHEEYDFFYQPPLTQEEIDDGTYRPENIVGSYAVYHKTKKNHRLGEINYATGKAFHIERPQVWEVGRKEETATWAELSYNEGELCVTPPQEFLDGATYPVRIDPTFGYTSVGGSTNHVIENTINGSQFTITEDGTGDSISAYLHLDSGSGDAAFNAKGNVYDTSLNLVANGATDEVNVGTSLNQWHTFSFSSSPSFTASTDYIIVVWGSSHVGGQYALPYDTGVTNQGRRDSETYGTWPDPMVPVITSIMKYSIYATYTASAGETTVNPFFKTSGDIQFSGDIKVSP